MNEYWVQIRKSGDFNKLGKAAGILPVTARILRNRDISDVSEMKKFIEGGIENLYDPLLLYGIDSAAGLLVEKIRENKKIRIIGDYDVDGICASYILYKGISFLGGDADFRIPHRIEDGYGINEKLIKDAFLEKREVIVTCDNGISAIDQTEYAKSLGLTMIITDHHEVPFETVGEEKRYKIPKADALVDPNLPYDEYPFKGISGAFVSYKFIEVAAKRAGVEESEDFKKLLYEFLSFASLATVCDVCELRDENHFLLKDGLKAIENTQNIGLKALLKATGLEGKKLTGYHLGFVLGPAINASGRLDTALRALELFITKDEKEAERISGELRDLNEERKDMTLRETKRAVEMVKENENRDKVIVLYLKDCHESIAGIIAGKVREVFYKPTYIITNSKEGLKGSGRSIDAYNMYEKLTEAGEFLTKFGGHKKAAGFSLTEKKLEAFKAYLNENSGLKEDDFREKLRIDMELPLGYANLRLVNEISLLEPFGMGNESPLFARLGVTFISGRLLGKNSNVAKYKVSDPEGGIYEMVYFGDIEEMKDFVGSIYGEEYRDKLHSGEKLNIKLDVCYQLSINSFKGVESVDYVLKYVR